MSTLVRPAFARAAIAAILLAAPMLATPPEAAARLRLRPGLEVGPLWGGMSGVDRLAIRGGDARGHTGSSAAALVELPWSDRWSLLTGVRYREVEETAPTGQQFFNGGLEYSYRLHTTLDLVSWPMLARVYPLRTPALSLELGPQLTWATHAETFVTFDLVGSPLGLSPARSGPAQPDALIFESLTHGLTSEYRNLVLEGVVGLVLEMPGVSHPPFVTARYTGGLNAITESAVRGARRTNTFEIGTGWHW